MRTISVASVVLASLAFTASAVASKPATDASATAMVRPVSAGVKPARVISSVNVLVPVEPELKIANNAEVVVALDVDTNGKASDIKVVKTPSVALDEPVMSAVRQFRFEPGTVNNQLVPMHMTLTVVLQR